MKSTLLFTMFVACILLSMTTGCAEMKVLGKLTVAMAEGTAESAKVTAGANTRLESSDLVKILEHTPYMRITGLPKGSWIIYEDKYGATQERKVDQTGSVSIAIPENTTVEIRVAVDKNGNGFTSVLDTDYEYRWTPSQKRFIPQKPRTLE